jgi:hypothetical protein
MNLRYDSINKRREGNMSTVKIFLQTIAKGLLALADEVEQIEKFMGKLETKGLKGPKRKTRDKARQPKKATAAGRRKETATGTVLAIVEKSIKGVDTETLKKKTGFSDKKIWNMINRLKREGKIRNAKRGVYVKV